MPPVDRPRKRRQRCMFVWGDQSVVGMPWLGACPNPATETMPGFLPELHLCLEHRRLVEELIDLAT